MLEILEDAYGRPIGNNLFYIICKEGGNSSRLYYSLGWQKNKDELRYVMEDHKGNKIILPKENLSGIYRISESSIVASIQAGMIDPSCATWFENLSGMKINLKPIKNSEKKSPAKIEERLEKLLEWSENSCTLVKRRDINLAGSARPILNELSEAFDKIDHLVQEYELQAESDPNLSESYPLEKVYSAAHKVCSELNKRWDEIFNLAKEKNFLDKIQLQAVREWNKRTKTRQL